MSVHRYRKGHRLIRLVAQHQDVRAIRKANNMKSRDQKNDIDRDSGGDESIEEIKDPMSGYATADALDPKADINRDKSGEGDVEELKDPMSGYASIDAVDPKSEINQSVEAAAEEMQDPMSGYASADAIGSEAAPKTTSSDK